MSERKHRERRRDLAAVQATGPLTLDAILHLATGSPVDLEEAVELTQESGIQLVRSEGDTWEDLERLATEGANAFAAAREIRERPAPADDLATETPATLYLREISRTPLLTPEQEVTLAQQVEAAQQAAERLESGDVSAADRHVLEEQIQVGNSARQKLIESNLRLVVSIAKRYLGRGLSFLDLVQEGNLGLQHAVEKFEWQRGYRFSTYAYWWIRQAVSRAVAEQGRTIRLPVHIIEQLTKLYNVARELHIELNRDPTPAEIGERLGISADKVREALRAAKVPLSLETPVGTEQDSTLADLIADAAGRAPAEIAEEEVLASTLNQALEETLTPREAQLIRLRYGLDREGAERTLAEVGQILGISRERVRQLEGTVMRKLRQAGRFKRDFADYIQ